MNEDKTTPAPNPLPANWTGFVSVGATAGTASGLACSLRVDAELRRGAGDDRDPRHHLRLAGAARADAGDGGVVHAERRHRALPRALDQPGHRDGERAEQRLAGLAVPRGVRLRLPHHRDVRRAGAGAGGLPRPVLRRGAEQAGTRRRSRRCPTADRRRAGPASPTRSGTAGSTCTGTAWASPPARRGTSATCWWTRGRPRASSTWSPSATARSRGRSRGCAPGSRPRWSKRTGRRRRRTRCRADWTGFVAVSATAGTASGLVCSLQVVRTCGGAPQAIEIRATTCAWPGPHAPTLETVEWSMVSADTARFHVRWSNPDTQTASEPTRARWPRSTSGRSPTTTSPSGRSRCWRSPRVATSTCTTTRR